MSFIFLRLFRNISAPNQASYEAGYQYFFSDTLNRMYHRPKIPLAPEAIFKIVVGVALDTNWIDHHLSPLCRVGNR